MLDKSLFVTPSVHEREVELADGTKHTLHFREYSGVVFAKYAVAARSEDLEQRSKAMAILIAASLCKEDGKPALTFEQACDLKPAPMNAIFRAALEANGYGKDEAGKASGPEATNGSGTS